MWHSSQLAALGLIASGHDVPPYCAAVIAAMTTRAIATSSSDTPGAASACPWMRRRWRRRRHIWDAYWTVIGVRRAGVRVEPQLTFAGTDLAAGRVAGP